ncbi:MAG: ChaN family lipoprotein [Bernardetiaceae bacterium]|nr:ChaN family lipoprotein [Bernardetiaceae bacterium]
MATIFASAQDRPAYVLYSKGGQPAEYKKLLKEAQKADIILFGELHDNPICHWLQLELTHDLHSEKAADLVLAAEMFERDNQLLIDELLAGTIELRHFEAEAKLWNNYKTDYYPLLAFAQANNLKFIASNIPRRYASLVARQGLDSLNTLPDEAKQFIAELPIEVDLEMPAYKKMLSMMGNAHGTSDKAANFAKAQAVKDATMAESIAKARGRNQTVLHFNGSYHSDNHESIVWYLKKLDPKLKILTISSVLAEDPKKLDDKDKDVADFIIAIPQRMTRTY